MGTGIARLGSRRKIFVTKAAGEPAPSSSMRETCIDSLLTFFEVIHHSLNCRTVIVRPVFQLSVHPDDLGVLAPRLGVLADQIADAGAEAPGAYDATGLVTGQFLYVLAEIHEHAELFREVAGACEDAAFLASVRVFRVDGRQSAASIDLNAHQILRTTTASDHRG